MALQLPTGATETLAYAIATKKPKVGTRIRASSIRTYFELVGISTDRMVKAVNNLKEIGYVTQDKDALIVQQAFIDDINS